MQKLAGKPDELADLEESELSESQKYCQIDNKQIEELYASYNLMKNFISTVIEESNDNIEEILTKYAEKQVRFEILPKNVMQILDKRIERMLKNKRLKKNWSCEDAQILYWTFSYFCKIHFINTVEQATLEVWEQISKLIPGSSPDSCMFKVLSLKKTKLAKQKWSEYESKLLAQITTSFQNKKNWRTISQQLYKQNKNEDRTFRNAKQCKQHWVCYLNPQLKKGSWNLSEDKKLMQHVYLSNGCRKWAEIARVFGGRTENALKNRYTLIIQRLRKQHNLSNSDDDLALIKDYLIKIQKMQQMHQTKKSNKQKKHSGSLINKSSTTSPSQQPVQIINKKNQNAFKKQTAEQKQQIKCPTMLNYLPFNTEMQLNVNFSINSNINALNISSSFMPLQNNSNSIMPMQIQYLPSFSIVNNSVSQVGQKENNSLNNDDIKIDHNQLFYLYSPYHNIGYQ